MSDTLYARLGGYDAIAAVVDNLLPRLASDPELGRFWKHRLFVYAGINHRLPQLPGIPLPVRLRSPILVQLRDFAAENPDLRFDRFQLIDSDFV